jgi:hypothetical protein
MPVTGKPKWWFKTNDICRKFAFINSCGDSVVKSYVTGNLIKKQILLNQLY